ncbi:hypothetical protein QQ020_21800 [Fulvivirgaceae bacterium BMA12]|uniref:Uncharacterized protein n=1 Tax=Agaribacillus aureus TaxID=3051825 RepID=A0ABT8LEK5_9BACT|nr:hypothetical protein [Fulvivirgaceae bacterium BMA12]
MTEISRALLLLFLVFPFNAFCQRGIIVEGKMKDSEEAYTILAYSPRMRGNLNFDGFKSVGAQINDEGKFRLEAKNITHAANYRLFFPKHMIPLLLFDGDSIYLEIYHTDIKQTFATGRGAGKINVLNLPQLQYEYFDLEQERNLNDFVHYTDSIIAYQHSLLAAVYARQLNDSLISGAPNKNHIKKIINNTPISPEAYELLCNLVEFQRYSLISSFLTKKSAQGHSDSVSIDFNSASFRHFNVEAYRQLKNIDDWRLHNSLESILQIEYLKEKQSQESQTPTYGNWRNMFSSNDYMNWRSEFLRIHFDREIFNKYYAEYVTGFMTWGMDYASLLNHINLHENNKYVNRIQEFIQLLNHGLNNEAYGLNQTAKYLDKKKFENLLSSYKQSPLLIVFWSAQAAGASIIDELPSLKAFEANTKDEITLVYICVDKQANKNLWAARVIDESWKAKHYFLPIEENETTLDKITDKDISTLCSGGSTYIFIDNNGAYSKEVKGPFYWPKIQ